MKVLKYLIVFIHFLRSAWHWEIKRVAVKGEGSQRGIWLVGLFSMGNVTASSLRSFSVPKVRWVINQLTIHTHNGGASQWSADSQQTGAFVSQFMCPSNIQSEFMRRIQRECFWLYIHIDITQNEFMHTSLSDLLSFVRVNESNKHDYCKSDKQNPFCDYICFPQVKTRQ